MGADRAASAVAVTVTATSDASALQRGSPAEGGTPYMCIRYPGAYIRHAAWGRISRAMLCALNGNAPIRCGIEIVTRTGRASVCNRAVWCYFGLDHSYNGFDGTAFVDVSSRNVGEPRCRRLNLYTRKLRHIPPPCSERACGTTT